MIVNLFCHLNNVIVPLMICAHFIALAWWFELSSIPPDSRMASLKNIEASRQELRWGSEWGDSLRLLFLQPGSERETDPNSAAHLFRCPAIIGAGIELLQFVNTPGAPRLCDYCDSIHLERLFDASIDHGRMNLNGRFVAPLSSTDRCSLCCLLASIRPPWWKGETVLIQSSYFSALPTTRGTTSVSSTL